MRLTALAATLALLVSCSSGDPEHGITLPSVGFEVVVPFSRGGGTDLMFQAAREPLENALGEGLKPVYVTGAGGLTGSQAAYTHMDSGRLHLAHALKSLHHMHAQGDTRYGLDDLDIYIGWRVPPLISVNADDERFPDVDALVKALRDGMPLRVSTSGKLSGGDLALRAIKKMVPTANLTAAHYQGGSIAIQKLVEREVDLTMQLYTEQAEMLDGGFLRGMAVMDTKTHNGHESIGKALGADIPPMAVSFGMAVSHNAPAAVREQFSKAWAEVDMTRIAARNGSQAFDNGLGQKAIKAIVLQELEVDKWILSD